MQTRCSLRAPPTDLCCPACRHALLRSLSPLTDTYTYRCARGCWHDAMDDETLERFGRRHFPLGSRVMVPLRAEHLRSPIQDSDARRAMARLEADVLHVFEDARSLYGACVGK